MLRTRAELLVTEIRPRVLAEMNKPPEVRPKLTSREARLQREVTKLLGKETIGRLSGEGRRRMKERGFDGSALTDAEAAGVYVYTTEESRWSYHETNDALYEENKAEIKRLKPLIDATNDGIRKFPAFDGEMLYRGTTVPEKDARLLKVGKVVTWRGFTSTTGDPNKVFGGKHLFHIIPHGGANNIRSISRYPGEDEFLYPAGTKFKVLKQEERRGRIFFLLEEVPPKTAKSAGVEKAMTRKEYERFIDQFEEAQANATEPVSAHIQRHMNAPMGMTPADQLTVMEQLEMEEEAERARDRRNQ